jgi:caa(3)-type oxidase subunit IV
MKTATQNEGSLLSMASGAVAAVCLAAPILLLARYGISVDTLFGLVVGLTLSAIFGVNPLLELREPVEQMIVESKKINQTQAHKTYYMVWAGLLVLTVIEIVLIFPNLSTVGMLLILVGLSLIKSYLIMYYFMHLRSETMSLKLTLIPITLILIGLFAIFFPDSYRALHRGVNLDTIKVEKAETPKAEH